MGYRPFRHGCSQRLAEHILKHNPEEIHILFDFDIDRSQYGGKDDPMVTLVKILSGNATEYQIKKYHKLANPTLSKKLHDIYKYERELYLKHHPELAA